MIAYFGVLVLHKSLLAIIYLLSHQKDLAHTKAHWASPET